MITDQQFKEALQRISNLENTVKNLSRMLSEERMRTHSQKAQPLSQESKKRDIAYYFFEGETYNKRELVLTAVKHYLSDKNVNTAKQFKEVFPDFIQGSMGVIRSVEEAEKYENAVSRFYFDDRDILILEDGRYVVSKEWTAKNILQFLNKMEELGYKIHRIN